MFSVLHIAIFFIIIVHKLRKAAMSIVRIYVKDNNTLACYYQNFANA